MDELAEILSSEHGKTVADAKGSITRGLEVVEFACGIPHLLKGEFSEGVASGVDTFAMRQPVGVCAGMKLEPHLLRCSTSRPWRPCGCFRWRWHVAIRSF